MSTNSQTNTPTKYPIMRWDVVLSSDNHRIPMIYIKPDTDLLEFWRANKFICAVKMDGTEMGYDGNITIGFIQQSLNTPNCRPNLFNTTGWYCVTLQSSWLGYPIEGKLGTASFFGLHL
jgi:hypothetical protein